MKYGPFLAICEIFIIQNRSVFQFRSVIDVFDYPNLSKFSVLIKYHDNLTNSQNGSKLANI